MQLLAGYPNQSMKTYAQTTIAQKHSSHAYIYLCSSAISPPQSLRPHSPLPHRRSIHKMEFAAVSHRSILLGIVLVIPAVYVVRYYYVTLSHRYGSPPTVFPTFPILGDALYYLYTPFKYFHRCKAAYGPVFTCLLGSRRMVIICDDIGIHAVLRDKYRTLSTYSIHEEVSASLGKIGPKASRYLPNVMLPLSGDLFSMAGLMHIIPALNRTIYYYVENAKLSADLPTKLSLSTFVGEAIYSAVSVGVFGEQFPLSTFPDFEAIDTNFTNIISKLPFLSRSATLAREHMRVEVAAYIDNAGPECGIGTLPEPATKLLKVLADPQLTKDDRDALMVTYIWGLHSSTIRTAFWLFAYLLNDQRALNLVRDEIDKTVAAEFKDMDSLLDAPASALDGPGFAYLTSAVKEALRLSSVIAPVREVSEDTFITLSTGETYPLRKGEFVTANIPMMHHYENSTYDSPSQFRVDRFFVKEGKKGKGPYLPWGTGEHICKGRYLAMHTLKIFTILVLRSLDVKAITETGGSFNTPFVRANPSFLERWQMRTDKPIHIHVSKRVRVERT